MGAKKTKNGQEPEVHEMLIRLLTVAEILISPPEAEHPHENDENDEERSKYGAICAALQKTQAAQVDV
ncbi:MAG: hypothetical protein ACYDBJ_27910 [Aggregatilineales bacterium]